MKKYKHKKLGWVAEYVDEYYYEISNVLKELIENSDDWEPIHERNSYVMPGDVGEAFNMTVGYNATANKFNPKVGEWMWYGDSAYKVVEDVCVRPFDVSKCSFAYSHSKRLATKDEIFETQKKYWEGKGFKVGAKVRCEREGVIINYRMDKDYIFYVECEYITECNRIKVIQTPDVLELLPDLPTKVGGYDVKRISEKVLTVNGYGFYDHELERLLIEKSLTKEDVIELLKYFK